MYLCEAGIGSNTKFIGVLEDRGLDQHDPIYKYIYISCDQLDLYIFD